MPIKILIADDHRLFREGLVNLLGESEEIEIVGQAENGREVIQLAESLKPDIILMDITMPELSGIEATSILKRTCPDINIIALSMHSDQQYIKQALMEGAMGYLYKNCTYNQLIFAIKQVYSGKKYLSDEITESLISDYIEPDKKPTAATIHLTKREHEVLKLIAEGVPTKDISKKLFISIKTVGSHKQKLLEKLELKSNADLIKYALRNGIISLE